MLVQRLRRWPNNKSTLSELVFYGGTHSPHHPCESQTRPGTGQNQDRFRECALTKPRQEDPDQTPGLHIFSVDAMHSTL